MTRLFVTGAGTEVGKTFVCCEIIRALTGLRHLRVIKPVASGVDPNALEATDTVALLRAQGVEPSPAAFRATTPWSYRAPLSPDMAAARENARIPFDDLVAFSRGDGDADLAIIEGIGGALVPIDEAHTVLDWIAAVEASVWLVGGTYLGGISHTLATQAAIEARGISIAAIVISESAEAAAPLGEITAAISRFAGGTPVVGIARPPDMGQISRLVSLLPGPTDAQG